MNVLIFTGGQHPDKSQYDSYIKNCNLFDFVIAADSGFDTACSFGVECNLVIGDMDSITNKDALSHVPKSSVVTYPTDKDFTDTELALNEAKKRGATKITLVGGDGGRIDHTLALLKIFQCAPFPNTWLCKEQVVFLLDEAKHPEQLFFLSPKESISIFSVFEEGKIYSDGLEWELNNITWKDGAYSISNRVKSSIEKVSLKVLKGRFFVLLPYSIFKMNEI